MKTLIEILDEQSSEKHPSEVSYYNNDEIDCFDGKFSHVQSATDEYVLQFIEEIRKQVESQCGNEYGTISFIDKLKKDLNQHFSKPHNY